MGTSISQPSPETPNWRAVQAMYRADFPIERVAHEVWRAAANDPEAGWMVALSSPAVEVCRNLASTERDASRAVADATQLIALEHESSFAVEIAKLALASSAGEAQGLLRFTRELFEMATEYLVARDLSGFIGPRYRNHTINEATQFRLQVRQEVGNRVDLIARALPRLAVRSWPRTVEAIVGGLSSPENHAR